MQSPQPCSPQYGCPYQGAPCQGGPRQAPAPMMQGNVAVMKQQRVPVLTPSMSMPFPPQPPGHPSVMWGPLSGAGPCGVPSIPGIHSLTPGYEGYHGFPGYLENPAMRMGKSTLHYGGLGVINTQGKAWSAHFNPGMIKTKNPLGDRIERHIFGDSLTDRRLARVNEMKAALNRVDLEDKELRTGASAFAFR